MKTDLLRRGELQRTIKTRQFFTLAFGTIIGVGWCVALGDWLGSAGPLGTMLVFVAGGGLMMLIGFCYGELAGLLPAAGGEVVFTYSIYGPRTAFVAGWFLLLAWTATTSFEAISIAWVLDILFPGLQGEPLYTVLGEPITPGALLLGLGGMAAMTALNYRGAKLTAGSQDLMTYGLLLVTGIFVACAISWGDPANMRPLFQRTESRTLLSGVLGVLVTTPFWLSGFEVIPQAMEERRRGTSLQSAGRVMTMAWRWRCSSTAAS